LPVILINLRYSTKEPFNFHIDRYTLNMEA